MGTMDLVIRVKRLNPEAILPKYSHNGLSGDLAADLYAVEARDFAPGDVAQVGTGLAMEMPAGFGALVEDRSGLASKGLTTLAGVIDTGYRGEIRVVLANVGRQAITLKPGDRIAQLRIVRRFEAEFCEVENLSPSARDAKGFGSTGA
jgi:dUTP pyrophosphatase